MYFRCLFPHPASVGICFPTAAKNPNSKSSLLMGKQIPTEQIPTYSHILLGFVLVGVWHFYAAVCRVRQSYVFTSCILYIECDNLLCIFAFLRCVYILASYILYSGCENHMFSHPVFYMQGASICYVFSLFCVACIFLHLIFCA